MRVHLVGLSALMLIGAVLVGCGSGGTGGPGVGGDPPAGVETVTVGSMQVGVASATGFKTLPLSSSGPVGFTVMYGTEILRLQEFGRGALLAVSVTDGDDDEIQTMTLDGTGLVPVTDHPGRDWEPAWSADGAKIAFTGGGSLGIEIFTINADGTGLAQLTDSVADDDQPTWSPDGAKIAFRAYDGSNSEIFVMNADGTGLTNLTDNTAHNVTPSWSPDGERIAYVSSEFADTEVWVMNDDGLQQRQLTDNAYYEYEPAWSPDGRRIAYVTTSDANDQEIAVMNADGSGQTRVTDNSVSDSSPTWSPDGSRIAFAGFDPDDPEIFIMDADGSNLEQITANWDYEWHPAWCPGPGLKRTLIGEDGTDRGSDPPLGDSRPCAIVGVRQGGMVSAATIIMSKSHWGSLEVEAMPDFSTEVSGLKITASNVKGVKEDIGRSIPPLLWNIRNTPPTGAVLIFFRVNTGQIETVIASADEPLGTSGDVVASGGRLVLRGEFTDVLTAPDRNLADVGTREVVLDSETGEVIEVH